MQGRTASLLSLPALTLSLLVTACHGDRESPTGPESPAALDASATAALTFSGMTAGTDFSCGVATDGRGFCWGRADDGQLGNGTTIPGTTGQLTPAAVVGGLRFRQLATGHTTTCGVTTDNRAYCWGRNDRGQIGDGTTTLRLTPVAVVGGHKFSQVEITFEHTCGLSYPDNKAYCWGWNGDGQLGIGNNTGPLTGDFGPYSPTPVAVQGGLTFSRITTGDFHSCGLTTGNKIYCWGLNQLGEIGDGTTTFRRPSPRLVTGGLAFNWVNAGALHTCGITTAHKAYCWGSGQYGQRGDGSVTQAVRTPRAVLGGHLFTKVNTGVAHTCGVTTSNQAWCWGRNESGQLGDGTTTQRLTPHLVAGAHAFNQVNSGGAHTCARTTAAVGYCWGRNPNGQLGNGTTTGSLTPVMVN
jgi:alpha-tubulin suppressor-like RCC1 family protein